ncbi:peptidase families S8 and S53 domain protein [Flavobacteriaceae bacterium 3519-10]|nr:peptidase families S8 and S53 domain protein [Flavobacteriaceae bacterium 3519-10]
MKKLYLLAATAIVGFTLAQNRPSDAQMAPIFAKMNAVSNPAAPEPHGFFTEEEGNLIRAYYAHDAGTPSVSTAALANNDAHVLDARNVSRPYGHFPYLGPYTLTVTGTIPSTRAVYSDDYDQNGTLYALDNTSRALLIVNPADASVTQVATITGIPAAETLGGLAFNYVNNQFYVLGSTTLSTQLYSLNPTTAVATPIGSIPGILGIWLVIDNDGNAYTADLTLDNLLQINLTTGTAAVVGPLGININFAQDADVNTADNTIYMAAYIGAGVGGIYSVSKTTGTATLIGSTTANNAEYTMFSIENPSPLAVDDSSVKNALQIYPNPVKDVLNIATKAKIENAEILNLEGKLVMKTKASQAIDVSSLRPGVYILKAAVDGRIQTVKFIKK